MGVSTDAILCYGISFEEDTQFPWDEYEFEDWWYYNRLGFSPTEEIYDEYGEYLEGIAEGDPRISKYYQEKRDFKQLQPECPYELVTHCYHDEPMYILALARTVLTANRGRPQQFDPSELVVTEVAKQALVDLCIDYEIEALAEPAWYLSSYWG